MSAIEAALKELEEQGIDIFKLCFDEHDKDKDGFLSNAELCELLSEGEADKMPKRQIDLVMKLYDANSDGKIDYTEFLNLINGNFMDFDSEESCKRVFTAFAGADKDHLSKEQMKEAILTMDDSLSEEKIKKFLTSVELKSDKIGLEGFINMMKELEKFGNEEE